MTDTPVHVDPLAEAAMLVRDVGLIAQYARRYRALVDVAASIFERTLTLGTDIRCAARATNEPDATIQQAITELRGLLTSGKAGIDEIKRTATYQDAINMFREGDPERVAPLAAAIFAHVVPHTPVDTLYWAVPLRSGRSGIHFIAPEDCASRVGMIATEGLSAPAEEPDLGGDDTIRPVTLTDEHDESESPIALAFDPQTLPSSMCHLEESSLVLFYANRLQSTFSVRCSAHANDEWWNISPDAYRKYVIEFRDALRRKAPNLTVEG